MKKLIVITSGKGGVGKTTTAINLGAAIKHFDRDVLIIDGNLTTPNVGIYLGCPEVPVSLNHVISNRADASEAVYEHESGMKIIPSSLSLKELKNINYNKLKNFKKDFKKISDYVIVDSGAGLGEEAVSAIKMADDIILITNPEMPAITDALKTIKLAEQMKKNILGVIITKVRNDDIEMQPETVKEMLETQILGMIPHDPDLQRSQKSKKTVIQTHPKSKSARAYKEIAAKILDIDYDSNKDKEGIFERLFKKFGKK